MDETPSPQNPDSTPGLNKLDLSQLQGFSFGTSWSQDKSAPGGAPRGDRREERPRREGDAPARRDRRGDFKRPAPAAPAGPGGEGEAGAPAAPAGEGRPERGDRPPRFGGGPGGERRFDRREGGGPGHGGPRGGGPGGERPRFERREGGEGRRDFRGPPREPAGPYISPMLGVTFYPEDTSFKALADAIRKSCRTFELFYIARSVIEKNERFVAVVQRLAPGAKPGAPAAAAPAAEEAAAAPATPGVKPAPFFISVPDGLPFETEDAAIAHVLEKHLSLFFDTSEVEVEAPKGNFQVVNRCTITGALLAPPNYHRYNAILLQHHAANVRMPLEAYKSKVESVRDPEVVAQWLEKMKKAVRYTVKPAPAKAPKGGENAAAPSAATPAGGAAETAPAEAAPVAAPEVESVVADASATPAPAPAAEGAPTADATPAAEAPPARSFDSLEDARQYLLTEARHRVVRSVEQLRFPGRILENIPANTEIRRAVEGALAAQRRFPLDTANALRGRLRREGFTIFKKGSKGISYVCAVKRRFRVPGQTFSDSLAALIAYIEAHPLVKGSELPEKHLGLAARPAPAEGAEAAPIPADEQEKLTRLKGDLRYLVKEGYVTEFVDGTLFCPPPMVEARKREIENSEVDPENFPEAPKTAAAPAPAPAPAAETPAAAPADPAAEVSAEAAPSPAGEEKPAEPAS